MADAIPPPGGHRGSADSADSADPADSADRTPWARSVAIQLTGFLRTESGSSGILASAIVVALIWANLSRTSYNAVWELAFSVHLGGASIDADLRTWISGGLMALFFLVVGVEARREFDLGSLRDRSQVALPFVAGLVGMVVPVLLYLSITLGSPDARGWGAAMSTDTALALGLLSLVGRGLPDRVRAFLLTLFIVDDVAALIVIAVAYSAHVDVLPLAVSLVAFLLMILARRWRAPVAIPILLGLLTWGALFFSGIDPVVSGLAIGLAAPAYSPGRRDLEEATGRFRRFREQPTPALARSATAGLRASLSPNERLESVLHPWTSFVIVPLFALANAGTLLDAPALRSAATSRITLGIFLAYVVGKPVAIIAATWLARTITRGRLTLPVGWAAIAGSGTIAGVGFTVSLLVASLAFHGGLLNQAKIGILAAVIASTIITWVVYRIAALLPAERRARALIGEGDQLIDLCTPLDADRDHVRGDDGASVTIVEYGDFECPYCGRAEPAVQELSVEIGVRFVWRHLPLTDVHPHAALAAEAAEAAAAQGAFWPMHDALLGHQDQLRPADLRRYAEDIGLDVDRFQRDLAGHVHRKRVAEDMRTADYSSVSGTPTFFVNGRRHYGSYNIEALREAVRSAHQLTVAAPDRGSPSTHRGTHGTSRG